MVNQIKYEKIETDYKSPFKVVEIAIPENSSVNKIEKHWHRSLEFLVPIQNGIESWVEGDVYQTIPDEILLINSRYIHECTAVNPNLSYQGYLVQFKYDFISQVVSDIDNFKFQVLYNLKEHRRFFELIYAIIDTQKNATPYQHIKLLSLAYELIHELLTNACIGYEEKKVSGKSRLVEVLSYLDQHASDTFDATLIADSFHISYGHLAKMFKRDLGMSMKDYVNSVRVREASFDLLTTNASIVDIASKHGFSSSKAFYKEFEKIYHMTPKQYRNKGLQ